jgi:uncharacterized protein (TIGR02996 family)
MTDRDALLSAIREHPDEDTPRLMYADFLDEVGGDANAARAEFIRIQCELALLSLNDVKRPTLEAREGKLLKKFGQSWKKEAAGGAINADTQASIEDRMCPANREGIRNANSKLTKWHLSGFAPETQWKLTFRRGFAHSIDKSEAFIRKNIGTLLSQKPAPMIGITNMGLKEVRALPNNPLLSDQRAEKVPGLMLHIGSEARVQEGHRGRVIEALQDSHLSNLKFLGFDSFWLTRHQTENLVSAPCMDSVQTLCLDNTVPQEAVPAIAETRQLPNLTTLMLRTPITGYEDGNPLGLILDPNAIRELTNQLADSPMLPQLRYVLFSARYRMSNMARSDMHFNLFDLKLPRI